MSVLKFLEDDERKRSQKFFWIWTGAGVMAMAVVWIWFGFSVHEEISEQGKAAVAGQTMDGFAASAGGIPLAIAHMIGLALLAPCGWRGWRAVGLAYSLAALAATSLVGVGLAQLLFEGRVFGYE